MLEKEPEILKTQSILIIEPLDISGSECYEQLNEFRGLTNKEKCKHIAVALTVNNYQSIFEENIRNALIIDLAVRLGTQDLIRECSNYNCLYINTALDIWPEQQSQSYQSIYDIKQKILKQSLDNHMQNTAILNFGANPGLISHFVKASLSDLSKNDKQLSLYIQNNEYNKVAQALNLTLIQISERDTQELKQRLNPIFATCKQTKQERQYSSCQMINTWSVIGFLDEAYDKGQISIGTHETNLPPNYNQEYLNQSGQIILDKPGVALKTVSFEPLGGKLIGFNIPHAECYSLVDFLRVSNIYRPGSHYSYFPCETCRQITTYADQIDRFTINTFTEDYIEKKVLRNDEISNGYDSLGALMYFRIPTVDGHYKLRTLWSGTILDSKEAKKRGSEINATTIQVAISTLAAIVWILDPKNQKKGVLEPEALPTEYILDYCYPYLGSVLINYDCSARYQAESDQYFDLLINENK